MTTDDAEIPTNRCGFELRPGDFDAVLPPDEWRKATRAICCWRSVWQKHEDTERCIWHADVDEKPIQELLTARNNGPERLDGMILRGINIGNRLSLSECGLRGATFENVDFSQATFANANLALATFSNTNLYSAKFHDSNLYRATFPDAEIRVAEFQDAHLDSATFPGAVLFGATFSSAHLRYAQFLDADLQRSTFSDADAFGANFRHANLQDTVFTRTDCREATFTSALLYETVFSDVRSNSQTTFFDPETTFYDSIMSRPGCVYEENLLTTNRLPEDVHSLGAARWVYRRLESLHEENALSEEARQFHISKEEAERSLYWDHGKYGPWAVKTLMWYLTRHGESVKRVLTWWGGVILTAGLLFAGLGGVQDADGTVYAITSLSEVGTIAGWQDILMNIYFSVTTFSTIMDGGLAPAGDETRAVVAGESIIGALLVALLVFVLGRRTAR